MKQKKISIRVKPKKQRKEWGINPVQRAHSETAYNRNSIKQDFRKTINEESEDHHP